MNSVRSHSGADDIWEFVIRGADTGKCSLSEKIYELFVETNEIVCYKGVRIKGRGVPLYIFTLQILVLTLIRRLMRAGALP